MILDLDILVKDLDLALFFILDIKTELSTQNYQHKIINTKIKCFFSFFDFFFDSVGLVTFLLIKLFEK